MVEIGSDMNAGLVVAICTREPNMRVLGETLHHLECQTLPRSAWELIIVDSASPEAVDEASIREITNLPFRLWREKEPGLNAARRSAIRAATGGLLVFVDDDNLLAPDYLEVALAIAEDHRTLGAWGAGRIRPRFESPPASGMDELVGLLGLKQEEHPRWTNVHEYMSCVPIGAGLCVRREVAVRYCDAADASPVRGKLGRTGPFEVSGEDVDLALTALDEGMGIGLFPSLSIEHCIPTNRVGLGYLLPLAERVAAGLVVLKAVRQGPPRPPLRSDRLIWFLRWLAKGKLGRLELKAHLRGADRGRRFVWEHRTWFPCPTVRPDWQAGGDKGVTKQAHEPIQQNFNR